MVNHHLNVNSLKSAWQEKYHAKKSLKLFSDAKLQMDQGDKLLALGNATKAISCYQQALKIAPNSQKAHQKLAQALKKQGELADASRHYRQAINANTIPDKTKIPFFEQSNTVAVTSIYLQQANCFAKEGKWHDGILACQAALDIDPQSAVAYKIWGDNLQELGKQTEAMGYYAKALAIKPDFTDVCLNLGGLSFQQQQWQSAINYFQQAIAIDDKCVSAYRNLARVYKKLNQQQPMLDYWYQALQLEPTKVNAEEHCNLGKVMMELNRPQEAISCYQTAIQLQSTSVQNYLNLGELLSFQGKNTQAMAVYQQGLKIFPRHSRLNLELGNLLSQNQPKKAIACYQQVIQTQPNTANAYAGIGDILSRLQQYQQAVKYYKKTLKLNSKQPRIYCYLVKLLLEQKQWQEVVKYSQQGLKNGANQTELIPELGFALLHLKQYSEAVQIYAYCLKLNPTNIDQQLVILEPQQELYYRLLAEVASKAEQYSEAAIAWKQAIQFNTSEVWCYHHLGMALIKLERWSEVRQALTKFIEYNPDFSWSYFHLGDAFAQDQYWSEAIAAYRHFLTKDVSTYAYERLGDCLLKQLKPFTAEAKILESEASHCYQRAIEVDRAYLPPYYKLMELQPYNPNIASMLAETYARSEEWSTAIVFYQMALQINPDLAEVHFELAIVLEQLEQLEPAKTHCQQAIKLAPHEFQHSSRLQEILERVND